MMEAEFDVLPLRVIRVRSNGKRDFDRADKRRIVEACLRPGVSVSGMALKLGINTNQLRKWIRLHQVARDCHRGHRVNVAGVRTGRRGERRDGRHRIASGTPTPVGRGASSHTSIAGSISDTRVTEGEAAQWRDGRT
ncbi:transposase [Cupriavidus sp. 2KB_3]|uniref:transposase n=1 Tax=Cupriavidus sp. 2KB_3 TaxID=3232980 RepID=UPI003F8ED381